MLSNLVPVQLWPFSKGQRSTKQAISGFFFMWPLKMSFHVTLWLRSVHAQAFTESLDSSAATSAHVFLQLNKWNYFHYYQTLIDVIQLHQSKIANPTLKYATCYLPTYQPPATCLPSCETCSPKVESETSTHLTCFAKWVAVYARYIRTI